MPLRIVIDARWIFPRLSGIGLYTRELITRLARLDVEDDFILLFDHPVVADRIRREADLDSCDRVRVRRIDYGAFHPATQFRLPRLLAELGADVYHAPNYVIPYRAFPKRGRRKTACVVTLHDLIPYCHPEYTPRARKRWLGPVFRRMVRETARRSNRIIVPSRATADDVRVHLFAGDAPENRIRVIPEGVDVRFRPGKEPGDPGPPEILYVGRHDPYKNVSLLIDAFSRVRRRIPDVRLRLVGEHDPRYPEAINRIAALGLESCVIHEGYADNHALVRAYRGASVLAHPSRCEGFGLTVVEAMACGTPVVCSRAGSLPEVVGDAAICVETDSLQDLTEALIRVLSDKDLAARLRSAGLARARAFSWPSAARATLDVYRAAAEDRE